jgi:hypothetical protein
MDGGEDQFRPSRFAVGLVGGLGTTAILSAPAVMSMTTEPPLAVGGLFLLGGGYLLAKAVQLARASMILGPKELRYRGRVVPYEAMREIRKTWISSRNLDCSRSLLANSWRYEIEIEEEKPLVVWGKLYPEDERCMAEVARRAGISTRRPSG